MIQAARLKVGKNNSCPPKPGGHYKTQTSHDPGSDLKGKALSSGPTLTLEGGKGFTKGSFTFPSGESSLTSEPPL